MFSNCKTLNEMKIQRVELMNNAKSEDEIIEINNAFNARRKELTAVKPAQQKKFTQVTVDISPKPKIDYFCTESSNDCNYMKFTPVNAGFKVVI